MRQSWLPRSLGISPNPHAYKAPAGAANPIRALVFDPHPVTRVQFSLDGSGVWQDMQQPSGAPIWCAGRTLWNSCSRVG
ncbi:MAG: hypothetical protein FJ128_14150 [Deltaproteobacteria bacterium]|nr:hypothetical protein [Deltaproteobacteria bacterium]